MTKSQELNYDIIALFIAEYTNSDTKRESMKKKALEHVKSQWLDIVSGSHYEKYLEIRKEVIIEIIEVLMTAPDNEIYVDDDNGSLVVNRIDDQESEVIQRVWLKYDVRGYNNSKVMVSGGVFEEDWSNSLEDYPFETILAVHKAVGCKS